MVAIKRLFTLLSGAFLIFSLNGCTNQTEIVGKSFAPSVNEAKEYTLKNGLLKSIDIVRRTPPGPVVTMLIGKDGEGNEKIVWLDGDSKGYIHLTGSVLLKDGMAKNEILSKIKEKGFDSDTIEDIYVAPQDYNAKRIVWCVHMKGPDQHSFVFDFKTGELLVEHYQKSF
ncbi:hypothetical protein [Effusibacillus consociatus]|uniref:DUF4309 domain-containing protein n=1 Tax=Effusibacillus consociatus TaxID=1117041 RepID=A0ABV9Q7U9_9BACL